MTDDRYVWSYDPKTKKPTKYDTEKYNPIVTAPAGGWTHEDREELERDAEARMYLIFVRTNNGKVWKIRRPPFNAKSIPLNDSRTTPSGKQRLRYEEIESLGNCSQVGEDEEDEDGNIEATVAKTEPVEHAERDHALLSASGANRWINCTPSAYLEAQHPDDASDAAAEGTAAHELAEHKLRQHLDLPTKRPVSEWDSEEMEEYTDDYADRVMAELARAREEDPAAFLALEERLDFSHIVPGGFGTGDAVIVGDGTLTVVDLKYGKGVTVDAEGNPQMRLYALGALATYGMIYDIRTVRMVIFQPRIDNISVDEITVEDLVAWAEDVVRPAADLAIKGEGDMAAGKWCQFCRHAPECPARAQAVFTPIPMDDTTKAPAAPDPDTLTDEQIAQIITWADELKTWLGKVEDHALDQALTGKQYPGLKVVEGRSNRHYTDKDAVAKAVQDAGEDPFKPREVLGITAMEKLLGKKRFGELLGDHVHKPEGKPALVPVSDKRPAMALQTPETVFTPITDGAASA